MKKIFTVFFLLIFLLPCLFSCVEEYPEPIFDPSKVSPEDRKLILTEEADGITYHVFNDNTCEIVSFAGTLSGTTTLDLPDEIDGSRVVAIYDGVFANTDFRSVTLPKYLRSLGKRAFQKCPIKSITLPDSLVEMGEECFDNCLNLEEVTFGKGLKKIPLSAFFGCNKIKEISLPEGVEIIEEEAFASLSSLEKISLPESLKEIGPYAFWNCGAKEISLPENLEILSETALKDSAIEKILYEGNNESILSVVEKYN